MVGLVRRPATAQLGAREFYSLILETSSHPDFCGQNSFKSENVAKSALLIAPRLMTTIAISVKQSTTSVMKNRLNPLESGAGTVSHNSQSVDDMKNSERKRSALVKRSTICLQLKRTRGQFVPVGVWGIRPIIPGNLGAGENHAWLNQQFCTLPGKQYPDLFPNFAHYFDVCRCWSSLDRVAPR